MKQISEIEIKPFHSHLFTKDGFENHREYIWYSCTNTDIYIYHLFSCQTLQLIRIQFYKFGLLTLQS